MSASVRGALLFLLALAGGLSAQGTIDLPSLRNNPQNNSYPFAGPSMRYQQWFSALEWQLQSAKPIRVTGMWFFAGPGRTGVGGRVADVEVTMANARPSTYSGTFDNNFVSGRTTVLPRQLITLQAPASNPFPIRLQFRNEFVWDGSSGVVVDIKVFDNGNGNQPYLYDLEYAPFTLGRTTRLFTINNPIARTAATTSANTGLAIRFLFDEALAWPFGSGCTGEGGRVPAHTVDGGLPIPGNSGYQMLLTGAAVQRTGVFLIGASDTQWNGTPLPFDLAPFGGVGCSLLVDLVATATVPTVGGGPGTGIARLPFPLPGQSSYVGASFYSQWIVLDPGASNGVLAVSNGMRHIVAFR